MFYARIQLSNKLALSKDGEPVDIVLHGDTPEELHAAVSALSSEAAYLLKDVEAEWGLGLPLSTRH